MKTYILFQEDDGLEEPLYIESGLPTGHVPCVGEIIKHHKVTRNEHGARRYPLQGTYRVIERKYSIFEKEGEELEMSCDLLVEEVRP